MSYLNIHLSLGWAGDERIVSFELPEDYAEWGEGQRNTYLDECYEDALTLVDSWTTFTDEPQEA